MMNDGEYSEEVGEENPCTKMCSSFGMCCLGFLCFPLALGLLAWNENHYACENKRILFAETKAESVGCDSTKVMNTFAFFSCPLIRESLETFTPTTFNPGLMDRTSEPPISFVSASGRQVVEMYQCQESCSESKKKNSAGQNVKTKTCSYSLGWSTGPIPSSQFKQAPGGSCPGFDLIHANPEFPQNVQPGSNQDFAQYVKVGKTSNPDSISTSYTLNHRLVQGLTPDEYVDLTPFARNFTGPAASTSGIQPWARPLIVSRTNLRVNQNTLETCIPPYQLGCVRITYSMSRARSPSVITRVTSAGETSPEKISGSWGCKASEWQEIVPRQMSKLEMISDLRTKSKTTVWIIRFAGAVFCSIAIYCCLSPISAAADVMGDVANFLPCCGGFLEDLIEGMVDWLLCLISCNLGCASAFFVIAIVWLIMRPLYGVGLLAIGCCCCCGAFGVKQAFHQGKSRDFDVESAE